jgi:drug/metabolite transporter (DMT)-like permease
LLLGNILGAVLGAPFLFVTPWPDSTGWLALLALGVVQQAFAYLCYAAAIRHARAIDVMLVPVIEPIAAPLWVALVFDQWPSGWALVGGAIVVGAVVARGVLAQATPVARQKT